MQQALFVGGVGLMVYQRYHQMNVVPTAESAEKAAQQMAGESVPDSNLPISTIRSVKANIDGSPGCNDINERLDSDQKATIEMAHLAREGEKVAFEGVAEPVAVYLEMPLKW